MAIREADDIQLGPWGTDGGVRYDLPSEDCAPTELVEMQNMRITAAGAVETRHGTSSYQSEANIATDPTLTLSLEFTAEPSTDHVVVVAGTAIYKYSSGWSAITGSVTVTAADDNTFEWCSANGVIYATNGADVPWKWTGTGNAADGVVSTKFTTGEHIAFWDNRVWYGNTDTDYDKLWHTDTAAHDTIDTTNFYLMGSAITGLEPSKDFLAVHCRNGIHIIRPTGNSSVPYQVIHTTSRATICGRGIITLPNDDQIFIRKDGFYKWDGDEEVEKISHSLDVGYWPDVNASRLHQAHAVYWPEESESWFFLPKGSTTENEEIVVYSDRHEKWFGPFVGSGTFFKRNCSGLIGNKPHAGAYFGSGSVGGKLLDHAPSSYNDDDDSAGGATIEQWFRTASPSPDSSAERLRWRYARTYYDSIGDYNIDVTQESSGVSGEIDVLETKGGFTLDTSLLDDEELGAVRMLSQDTEMTEYDPHSSLKFSLSALDNQMRIRRTHMVYTPIGHKRKRQAGVE